jgi:carboxyl-terminal processing protease
MGSTTYGKGLVQAIRELPHNTSLKMTTAQYRTPSGRSIQNLDPTPFRDTSTAASTRKTSSDRSTARGAHETTHGRTVHDGDGLRPDVELDASGPKTLVEALKRQAAFFYYANHYAASRDTLSADFAVTDATLDDFRAWLNEEEIRYPTEAERAVQRLRQEFSEEEYTDVETEVAELQKAVRAEKQEAFRTEAPALKRHLRREILARFVTESQRTAAMLPHDPQVDAAVTLLHDEGRYEEILAPEE